MACPRCCGSGAICGCMTCRRCSTRRQPDGEVLACYVLDPRLKSSSGPRRLQYLYDALRDLRDNLDGTASGHPRSPRATNSQVGQGDWRDIGTRVGGLLAVRPTTRRRCTRRAGRRAAGGVGIAVSGVPWPGHQGRRHAVQGVHALLRRLAPARLAAACRLGRGLGALDRPGRRAGRGGHSRRRGRAGAAGRRDGGAQAVGEVRGQPARRLRRRPQPAGPRRHQPDVGAPEVRHHPSAHDGRRPGPRQRRTGVPAGVGFSRLLRRGAL